jgi:hypothetical protein
MRKERGNIFQADLLGALGVDHAGEVAAGRLAAGASSVLELSAPDRLRLAHALPREPTKPVDSIEVRVNRRDL